MIWTKYKLFLGSGYGTYSLGYGGIPTSALFKNDETEATDIPSTLTELKTDYMQEYLEKLKQYTEAQDIYKTDIQYKVDIQKDTVIENPSGVSMRVFITISNVLGIVWC